MILSNSETQEVIEIVKITNGIVYTIYENNYKRSILKGVIHSKVWDFNEDLMPDASLSFKENKHKLAYEYLLTLPEYSEFVLLTDDEQAWTHSVRPTRLSIENSTIMNSVKEDDALNAIIVRLRDENALEVEKFIFSGETQTVVYVNEILEADQSAIQDKLGVSIFVETKEV